MTREIILTFDDDLERVTIGRVGLEKSEILGRLRDVCIILDEEESCKEKTN